MILGILPKNYTPKFIVKTLETKIFCQIKLSEINLTSIAGGSPVKSIHLTVSGVHDIGQDSGERGLAAVWWVEERRVSSSNSKRTFRFLQVQQFHFWCMFCCSALLNMDPKFLMLVKLKIINRILLFN